MFHGNVMIEEETLEASEAPQDLLRAHFFLLNPLKFSNRAGLQHRPPIICLYYTFKSFETLASPSYDLPSVMTMQVLGTSRLGIPLKIFSFTAFNARFVSVEPPVYFNLSILFFKPGREYRRESSKVRSINTLWSYLIRANLQTKH